MVSNIYAFEGFIPVIDHSAFVHPDATIIGNVIIGKNVYIGPGARIRGDWGGIVISDGCNVQENCVIHMFPGITVALEKDAHIGHGAIIHGAQIGRNAMIGMNTVVMDNVIVGEGSIVGAMSFVPEGTAIPERKLAVGCPIKIIRDVSDEMLNWKSTGTRLYQALPEQCRRSMYAVEPLREIPSIRPDQASTYMPWIKELKDENSK